MGTVKRPVQRPVIHGGGTSEKAWASCAWLWNQQMTSLEDLLRGARRLFVVAPHPDDEVLGCGGVIRQHARRGGEVLVVAVTDGEACYPGESHWTPDRLSDARRVELHAALRALGVPSPQIAHLGLPDGGISAQEANLERWLTLAVQEGDLVLAPWRFDGHPDHEAAGRAARRAAHAAGARILEYPVWGWHWLDPASAHMAWERPLLVDISADRAAKDAAIHCFRTQTGEVDALASPPVLPSTVLRRFQRAHEVFLA